MFGKTGELCSNYGKKTSEETKRKQSEAKIGDKNPKYWNGKKRSVETKEKLSKSLKGKLVGSLNGNWRGGSSFEPYCEQWKDNDFKESIKERDGYKCLNPSCNKNYINICVHHINYIKKDCRPTNLITVCFSCNSQANKDRAWHTAWYTAIIERRYNGNSSSRTY